LNYELGRMSILQAIDDPIRLEVYPDASNMASGNLYLDDGMSNQYKSGAQTYVTYTFNGTALIVFELNF
jgi:alpha-glucosidase (family GH31 glycosyl hydrolase)